MCGIIGYKGLRNAAEVGIKGLKKLEYRGYDSFGWAVKDGPELKIFKRVGKIGNYRNYSTESSGRISINHTRWATHGAVTVENTHPHTDCSGDIALVHNGIIENFQELRKELVKKGHVFTSQTDTEVIPHLIEEYSKKYPFIEASKRAIKRLKGSYAVLVINKKSDALIAARRNSPLVVGVGEYNSEKEYFIASDIPAFLEYTKNVVYLYDDDFVVINKSLNIFNLKENRKVNRKIDTVKWNAEQARRGKFRHYMLKEIAEQRETIRKAVEQNPDIIKRIAEKINSAKGVFFVGCGSSYHACLSASYIFSKIAKNHINVVLGSEFPNYEDFLTDGTLVIAVSQSGETADVLDAVRTAKKKNSEVISVVNVMGSSLTRHSDDFLLMHAGPEICVLSTKTYTSQLALLTLLAYTVADKYEEGKKELEYTWNLIYNLTSRNTRDYIKTLADKLKKQDHIFTIGRGLQYSTALEAALKIKEVSYIHAEGFAGGELKHGTIALIEKGTPCIVFISRETEKETVSNAMEIKARGGYIIGVGPDRNEVFDFFIKVPEVGNLNPICQIIPIQILAYTLAVLRGCDPDRPKNLAKSVTVL
jgi:glucosamine--fructose-6-phosphate aminotransferase (isomerizing)